MQKVFIVLSTLFILYSCESKQRSEADITKDMETLAEATKGDKVEEPDTEDDKTTRAWLIGKEWKAESGAAPMEFLRFISADSVQMASSSSKWSYKNKNFTMFGVSWPLEKVSDTSFTLYVDPTKKTFQYNLVKPM
ncbi:MAG: hypothetical protein ABIP79_01900 [Chitinophagaceae bacterium]